ncbi:MAG: hypothetical protein P9L99_13335 [Candidatus Lernaella stagnicola]|nr:hypothetical protein [Candidatus Lernaella stagnicola]
MLNMLTPDDRRTLRGYILRALFNVDPRWLPESSLKRFLHTVQCLPPDDELVREINFLREKRYLESKPIAGAGPAGREVFQHNITTWGYKLVTGETTDPDVWVM